MHTHIYTPFLPQSFLEWLREASEDEDESDEDEDDDE
jgi:hypothetical protein